MTGVLLALEQLIDQPGSFLGIRIGNKFGDVGRQRQLPGKVERDAAQELFVGGPRRRLDLAGFELFHHQVINLAGR